MALFADGPNIVIETAGLAAAGTAVAGAIVAASKFLLSYLKDKDTEHRGQVNGIIETTERNAAAERAECRETLKTVIDLSGRNTDAINALKDAIKGQK